MLRNFLLACIAASMFACSTAGTPEPVEGPAPTGASTMPTANRAVIASLQTRDHLLRIYDGGLFDLLDAEHTVIAAGLSEAELAAQYPEAHATYRTAIAEGVLPVMADVDGTVTEP